MSNDELSLDDMRSALAKWLAGLDGRQQNKRSIAGLLEAAFQRIDALKTRVEVLDVAFANSHQLNESLGDENRALRARAEAAEAEAVDLHRQLGGIAAAMEEIEGERLDLAARVAELEVELAAQSAQGWRDFTERPPTGEQIQIATVIDAVREEPDGLYRIGNTSEWQAWRPAPQEPPQ